MPSTCTAPIAHASLATISPPTSAAPQQAGHKPQSPLRAIRAKPGTRASNFIARRYRVHPAFADLVANSAGLGPEASGT